MVIGGAVVDISNLKADKIAFRDASDRWHRSQRSATDPVTVETAQIISEIAKKNLRNPLNLLGSHYATMANNATSDVAIENSNYYLSRLEFVRSAMLGDFYSMKVLSVSYGVAGKTNIFESAVWAYVAVEFGQGHDDYLGEMATRALGRLSSDQKDLARRRADGLIAEIRKNRADYDKFVGTDI